MNLIDIHNHMMFGIDDGAQTKLDTINMLKKAEQDGIKQILLTPHFKERVFENTKAIIDANMQTMEALIKDHGIDVRLYFGSEIYLSKHTNDLLNEGTLKTLNDSNYILLETHRSQAFQTLDFDEECYNLSVDGYKIIIAHPERYQFIQDNLNKVYDYVNRGYYIQLNVNSLLDPKHPLYKTSKTLLDHRLVHFIASDAHDLVKRPPLLSEAYQWVETKYGSQYAKELFIDNAAKVLNNENIKSQDYEKISKRRWFF
jgi:protein-tyrosine phosphatase